MHVARVEGSCAGCPRGQASSRRTSREPITGSNCVRRSSGTMSSSCGRIFLSAKGASSSALITMAKEVMDPETQRVLLEMIPNLGDESSIPVSSRVVFVEEFGRRQLTAQLVVHTPAGVIRLTRPLAPLGGALV